MQPLPEATEESNLTKEVPVPVRPAVHESLAPLLRGIGSAVILLTAIIGTYEAKSGLSAIKSVPLAAIQKSNDSSAAAKDGTVEALTKEVADLKEAVEEETVVDEVLRNPWIEALGTIGSVTVVASFFADWLNKRPKRAAS
jgi:hypothetical protein